MVLGIDPNTNFVYSLKLYRNPVEFFYSYFYIMPGLLPVLHSVLQLRGLDQFRVP